MSATVAPMMATLPPGGGVTTGRACGEKRPAAVQPTSDRSDPSQPQTKRARPDNDDTPRTIKTGQLRALAADRRLVEDRDRLQTDLARARSEADTLRANHETQLAKMKEARRRSKVKRAFYTSFANMPAYAGLRFKVETVEPIRNPVLEQRFKKARRQLRKKDHPIISRVAYHGTGPVNLATIKREGLQMSLAGSTDSGWFGRGLYLSPHADYTFLYGTTGKGLFPVTNGESGQIIQCEILMGRVKRLTDKLLGGPCSVGFDSHVSPNSFEYVVFDSARVLPRYIISYRAVAAKGAKFDGSPEQISVSVPSDYEDEDDYSDDESGGWLLDEEPAAVTAEVAPVTAEVAAVTAEVPVD